MTLQPEDDEVLEVHMCSWFPQCKRVFCWHSTGDTWPAVKFSLNRKDVISACTVDSMWPVHVPFSVHKVLKTLITSVVSQLPICVMAARARNVVRWLVGRLGLVEMLDNSLSILLAAIFYGRPTDSRLN